MEIPKQGTVMSWQLNKFKQHVVQRWSRMWSRMRRRAEWHIQGVMLWLLQRPWLRFVPMPYPSISNVPQWKLQAESMVSNKCLPLAHYRKAISADRFNAGNLNAAAWLRNRLGTKLAFLEDPIVEGMLAAKAAKGANTRLRAAQRQQAQEEAAQAVKEGRELEAVRSLIGPRGGLPALKQDLLRLAALCHVELKGDETVDKLKMLVRPVVQEILKKSPAKSSTEPAPQPLDLKSPTSPTSAVVSPAGSPQSVDMGQVQLLLDRQEEKFQTMMSQVMHHFMQVAPQSHPPTASTPSWHHIGDQPRALTKEELDEINAQEISDLNEQRMQVMYGENWREEVNMADYMMGDI